MMRKLFAPAVRLANHPARADRDLPGQFPARTGQVGQAYDGGFFYGGGVPPYTWSISAGALPPGLAINTSNSEVKGTPTKAGTFSFTARIADSTGTFLDSPQTITISG